MGLDKRGLDWGEISLRVALSVSGVSAAVVGTAKTGLLSQSLEWAAKGPMDGAWVAELRAAFSLHDQGWVGLLGRQLKTVSVCASSLQLLSI